MATPAELVREYFAALPPPSRRRMKEMRAIVTTAHSLGLKVAAHAHGANRRLGASSNHRVRGAAADDLPRLANRVSRCRTRRARGRVR